MSPMPQCSAILPFSIRNMSHDVNRSFRPVGGRTALVADAWGKEVTRRQSAGVVSVTCRLDRSEVHDPLPVIKRRGRTPPGVTAQGSLSHARYWLEPPRRAALGEKECKRRRERTALARAEVLSPILKAGEIDGDPGRVWWRDRCRSRL